MNNTTIERETQETANAPQQAQRVTYYTPLVDVTETGDAFVFQADMPGVTAGDVEISFDNGVLTLEGKVAPRQRPGTSYLRQEYGVGHFYRQFNLRTPVNAGAIRAELKNGVLELHVPKAESAKTRKIPVQSA
jgi:HSP20 family protein